MDKEDSGNDFIVGALVVLQSKIGQSNSINVLELETMTQFRRDVHTLKPHDAFLGSAEA